METRAAHTSRARSFRHWAYGTLIGGAVLAGGSAALAVWSNSRLPSAESLLSMLQKDAAFRGNGACDGSYNLSDDQLASCRKAMSSAQSDVDRYRNLRTLGIIGAVGGAALLGVGVTLWMVGPDPSRYDHEESMAGTLVPVLAASPDGASLWLRGSF